MEKFPNIHPYEDRPNTVEVQSESADYRIVYANHSRESNPQDAEGSDAIVLEFIFNQDSQESISKAVAYLVQNGPYKELAKYTARNNIPLYLLDLSSNAERYNEATIGAVAAETVVGAGLIRSGVSDLKKEKSTRRDFLKGIGKLTGGAYLGTPAAGTVMNLVSLGEGLQHEPTEGSVIRKIDRTLLETNEIIHPELRGLTVHGRNVLIAHKTEILAAQLSSQINRRPLISIVMGASHVGIEKDLVESREDRLTELKKYISATDLPKENKIIKVVCELKDGVVIPYIETSEISFD